MKELAFTSLLLFTLARLKQLKMSSIYLRQRRYTITFVLQHGELDKPETAAYKQLLLGLAQFEEATMITPFIEQTAYGYTFTDDVSKEQLQIVVDALTAAQPIGTLHDEESLALFIKI